MYRFERFLAGRFLRHAQGRTQGRRFLRFITYVAIGGVAVGVAALLLSLSIVRGFSREIEEKIVGFGAHVQVESFQDEPLDRAVPLREELSAVEGVASVAPVVQDFVLLRRSATRIDGIVLWGTEEVPHYLSDHLVEGSTSFQPDASGRAGIVIGRQLADLLDASVGDVVTAFSLQQAGSQESAVARLGRPRIKQFYVSGIYETSLENFDELYALTSLPVARELLDYGGDEVTRFDLTLLNIEQSGEVARGIEDQFGFPLMARTIYEVWRPLFAWVNLQESIIPVVISVIVLVAAFNIVGILLMIILEKTREIGVLQSMGASPTALRRLFFLLGILIGLVGTGLGEALALVLALVQKRFEIIPLPAEAYYMTVAPIALNPLDFLVVAVVALILCAAAAYIPARVASRIDPIRVIRFS